MKKSKQLTVVIKLGTYYPVGAVFRLSQVERPLANGFPFHRPRRHKLHCR